MRILVHDYAGHPFQVELSRELALRGHDVLHLYCGDLLTPRGELGSRPSDPSGLEIRPVMPKRRIDKTTLVRRRLQEIAYSRRLVSEVDGFRPHSVLSGNAPLDAQRLLIRWSREHGARFVFWVQDLIGEGAVRVLRKRFGAAGQVLGARLRALEGRLLRRSDEVVLITEDFRPRMAAFGVGEDRIHVIENWAPVDRVTPRPRDNPWARAHGLDGSAVLLYSGTLGMKHDPGILLRLATHLKSRGDVRIVVVSEGNGARWLAERKRALGLDRLEVLPFQPFEVLPDQLGSADVLLVLLEPDAGVFSVPSKVLTGLCAGRPLLLAIPPENLAARIVSRAGAGIACAPGDVEGFLAGAERLLADPGLRERMGRDARRYAEEHFGIAPIADSFEKVLAGKGGRV